MTRLARQRYGCSAHLLLARVRLSLLSQHHSTALPSPKRYGNRYEAEDPGRTSENFYSTHSGEYEHYCRCFSCKAKATTVPDKKVNTPTVPIAHEIPNASAMIPALSAPTA
jgi:hypothetical protein